MRVDIGKITSFNRYEAKMLLISIALGIVIAPVVMSLPWVIENVFDAVSLIGELPGGYLWMLVPLVAAGLAVGLITRAVSPESEGPGLQVVASAFHSRRTRLRTRSGPFKYLATLITVGAGSTAGVVSPSSLIGYSLGSAVAYRLGLKSESMRTISLCGMAAAISALLETPLGAAVFAVEVAYRNKILYWRFFYCLASALTASILSHVIKPMKPFLDISGQVPRITVVDLLTLFLISVTVTVISVLYIWLYQAFHDRFVRSYWRGHGWLKPAFGLLLAGMIMVPIYGTLMDLGYIGGYSGKLMPFDDLDVSRMLLVAIVLFLTSALIAASGNSGGLVMPIMTFGAIFGVCIASFFTGTDPLIFAAAGLTAAIATALNVPVAAAVICMELFGLPAFLPAMFGSLAGYFIGKRYVIYHEIKWRKIIS